MQHILSRKLFFSCFNCKNFCESQKFQETAKFAIFNFAILVFAIFVRDFLTEILLESKLASQANRRIKFLRNYLCGFETV